MNFRAGVLLFDIASIDKYYQIVYSLFDRFDACTCLSLAETPGLEIPAQFNIFNNKGLYIIPNRSP